MDEGRDDDLLRVRKVHTHNYCPRRYWLEEIGKVWVDNEHVQDGLGVHRRVDKPGGKLPAPKTGDDADAGTTAPWHARSLWLSSNTLGVSAKLDLVETDGAAVIPVDTKKGRAPDDGALWPADAIQLTLQALLLREAGYNVNEVGAFYAEERRKVLVPLTTEMEAAALAEVAAAKATSTMEAPPLPLVDSRKCLGCSVHSVCLPDEVNALLRRGGAEHGARRVVPPNNDALPVYISDYGARVGLKQQALRITFLKDAKPPVEVPLAQVQSVTVVGTAQVTTQALHAIMEQGAMVHYITSGGWLQGRVHGDGAALLHVRQAQFAHAQVQRGLEVARVLIADKIANVRTLLRRNDDAMPDVLLVQLKDLSDRSAVAADRTALLAVEAEAAKKAWAEYSQLLGTTAQEFAMTGRTRRPPRDRTNALLGFAYALLLKDCVHAVVGAGLDPFLGVFHTPQAGRPSLALDLMEPFRPLVADSVVLSLIRRGEVEPKGFAETGQAVAMLPHTRRALIGAYERRITEEITHPLFGYRIRYRQVLAVQARLLARALTGEIPAMPSFRTR